MWLADSATGTRTPVVPSDWRRMARARWRVALWCTLRCLVRSRPHRACSLDQGRGCRGGSGRRALLARRAQVVIASPPSLTSPGLPSTPLRIEAHEFSPSPEDLRAAPGSVAIEYVNKGAVVHTLVIEGVKGLKLEVPGPGDVDRGAVTLEPGSYTLFCDVPGHRQVGMGAPLTVG